MVIFAGSLWRAASALTLVSILALFAVAKPAAAEEAGAFQWRPLDAGFEVGELPVRGDRGDDTNRILLARVDPAKYRFVLRNDPAGHSLSEWMSALGAVMVINGGFFMHNGKPDAPMVSDGARLGPWTYDARHGAFVASGQTAGIRDLRKEDWRQAFAKADTALISFPLLIDADGGHSAQPSNKRAHRSFAAQDAAGRIVFGTTHSASFTLPDLAAYLKAAPLQLKLALNLDGGPFACQAIAHKDYARSFCGTREPAGNGGGETTPAEDASAKRRLPIALGIVPR
jgi:hypothetical protein